jgi:hypothetical protein
VDDDLPWASYEKDRLPRGWGWPLTRSTVAELLREQEVVVDHLHFSLPLLPVDSTQVGIVSARIPGNAVSSLRMPSDQRRGSRPWLSIDALSPGARKAIPAEVVRAEVVATIAWIATTMSSGDARLASDHARGTWWDGQRTVSRGN